MKEMAVTAPYPFCYTTYCSWDSPAADFDSPLASDLFLISSGDEFYEVFDDFLFVLFGVAGERWAL